jgi:hypothetical protein
MLIAEGAMLHATNQSPTLAFDFHAYAKTLRCAVGDYFTLHKKMQRDLPHFKPSIHFTQDMEIDLGLAIDRLKRVDVDETEKCKQAGITGKWLTQAYEILGEDVATALTEKAMQGYSQEEIMEYRRIYCEQHDRILLKAAAVHDRFLEHYDPEHIPWQAQKAKREGFLSKSAGILQDTNKQIQRLKQTQPELEHQTFDAELTCLQMQNDFLNLMLERSRIIETYSEEGYWRSRNMLETPESLRPILKQFYDFRSAQCQKNTSSYAVREVMKNCFTKLYAELDKAYPVGRAVT